MTHRGREVHSPEQPSQTVDEGQELSLPEAAALLNVPLRSLRRRVTLGELAAHKVNGVRGPEWRVSLPALEQAGYAPRTIDLTTKAEDAHPQVRRLTEALSAERTRSARLDRELGYALLTIGRLRGRLREVGADPDELFGAELGHDAGAASSGNAPNGGARD